MEENKVTLKSREQRLRRNAEKKNLFIRKRKWREYYTEYSYESHVGYCVGSYEYGLIIYGGDSWGKNLPTLDEAEVFVAAF